VSRLGVEGGLEWLSTMVSVVGTSASWEGKGESMPDNPTYEELQQRVQEFEKGELQHHRVEKALESERAFLSAVLDNIEEAIVICDGEGRLIRFNEASRRLHGLPAKPVSPDQWAEYYDLYRMDGMTPLPMEEIPLFRALKGEHVQYAEIVVAPKHALPHFLVCNGQALTNDQGRITGAAVAMHDITERKRAEQELNLRLKKIERFNRLAVGREQRILELKREINQLSRRLGQAQPYHSTSSDEPVAAEKQPDSHGPGAAPEEASEAVPPLETLINLNEFKELMHGFCESVGVASAIIDLDGVTLVQSHWQRLCMDFHRVNETTRRRCIESDTELSLRLKEGSKFTMYQCLNGLTDAASPIVIDGRHVANVFVGQFLLQPPPEDFFRRQAAQYGFDEKAYLEALREVPIISQEKLPAIVNYLTGFAVLVGTMGLERFRQKQSEARLAARNEDLLREQEAALSLAEDAEQARIAAERSRAALRESEERLRKSEQRFRDLFASISDVIYTQDLNGRFLSVNPAVCKLFGYSEEELIGRRVSDFMKPEFARAFESQYLEKIQKEGFHEGTSVYFTREGNRIYLEYRSSMVYPEEGEPYITGTGRDVTVKILSEREVRKLHAQLTQAQKMEAVGTLAGGIAHNFNNVLMGIQGRASLMMMDKDSTHPDYEHLKGIEEYVRSAAELTRDLLGFARGGKYEVKPIDLNELIRHESRMFARTRKEIRVNENYEKALWTVEADPGQMRQVFLNLYVNAWQAMPGGGDLYIQTENVTLDRKHVRPFELSPGRYVKISMTDTGVGMDDAVRERIFDPFFSTKDTGQGSGLGLASVYGIIKNHGGFIHVYSGKGTGTTFHIYLPASGKEAADQLLPTDRQELQYGHGTVLLVDDEEMILEVGRIMLEQLGYRVVVAGSGEEALGVYGEQKDEIDLVILDMIMPGMGGGEVFDRLNDMDRNVKVLLSSGYSANGQAKEILDRGCGGFIQKPFDLQELSRKVKEVSGR